MLRIISSFFNQRSVPSTVFEKLCPSPAENSHVEIVRDTHSAGDGEIERIWNTYNTFWQNPANGGYFGKRVFDTTDFGLNTSPISGARLY
jgi:hypothetical protein